MSNTAPGRIIQLTDDFSISRLGFGAMQLAGPNVFGPPKDRDEALAVLREAVALGATHIDTADFYGPAVVNELIREALSPYPAELTIATKVGARRGEDGSWIPSHGTDDLKAQVHDNLKHLGVDALDVVYLRSASHEGTTDDSLAAEFSALAELRDQGLIHHLGLSGVSLAQLREAQQIAPVVMVQNLYNLANRADDALLDLCAAEGIAFAAFFPLGGFSPLQSEELTNIALRLGSTPHAVALAWLYQRSATTVLIPGTSSVAHLRGNVAAADLVLPDDAIAELNAIGAA